MNRRNFLTLSLQLSVLLALKDRASWAAAQEDAIMLPKNIFVEPAAIEPMTGWLDRQNLAPAGQAMSGSYKAVYERVVLGGYDPANKLPRDRPVGQLVIERRAGAQELAYAVSENWQDNFGAYHSELNYACDPASERLTRWTLAFHTDKLGKTPRANVALAESGTVEYASGLATVKRKTGGTVVASKYSLPVIHQASILSLLAAGRLKTQDLSSVMAEPGMSLRRAQRIGFEGAVTIDAGGARHTLDAYRQTGIGVVPVHYLVDSVGAVQLVTAMEVNYALASVEAL